MQTPKTPLLLAAAMYAFAAGPAAHAQVREVVVHPPGKLGDAKQVKSKTVKFADLDLSKESDAETLVGRIRKASEQVCLPAPVHMANLKDVQNHEDCKDGAMSAAVQDLKNPLVQQVYGRTD
jgi:UrcA family protein